MNASKLMCTLGALALMGTGLPSVAAESPGWYIGGGIGQSRAEIAEDEIIADLLESGFETTSFSDDDRDLGYKLFAGYQFNRHFAVEGGYLDLGEFDFIADTDPAGLLEGELEFSGWNLDVVAMVPVSDRASLFARIGRHRSKAEVAFVGTGAVNVLESRFSKTDSNVKLGLGFQYQMTDVLSLRLEAERYRMDDAVGNDGDLDLLSAGLVFDLGRRAPAAPRTEPPATVPRAAAAVEEPTLVVVPLPVKTEEYCSLLDIQFEIDMDEIQRAERDKLGVVATFLERYPRTSAVIEGHTDNVGSADNNLRLSQRRAESVVDYLVSSHGIARSRLTAVGHGETRPIADNRTEAGKQANRRIGTLIGCATDIAGLEPMPARMTLAMQIHFDADSARVKPEFHDQLRQVAEFLNANPQLNATMEGHTDNARPEVAQRIAQQRSQNVVEYLVARLDVDRSRLTARGFGEARRFAYNTSAEGRQENRRVNIILDYPD